MDLLAKGQPLQRRDVVFKAGGRARRYIARIDEEGSIVVTIPRGGTQRDGLAFANEHAQWLREQQAEALAKRQAREDLRPGDKIWLRGEPVLLHLEKDLGRPTLSFGDERVFVADAQMNLARPVMEKLKELAKRDLPIRIRELAEASNLSVVRVSIRNPKTRWGSCSTSGTISLSWRLIQLPPELSDYVIIHELMHLREHNHSHRFWRLVREACPDYKKRERLLDAFQKKLLW